MNCESSLTDRSRSHRPARHTHTLRAVRRSVASFSYPDCGLGIIGVETAVPSWEELDRRGNRAGTFRRWCLKRSRISSLGPPGSRGP